VLQPAFTRPEFRNAWVVFAGWVLTAGTHVVTQALVVTDVARRLHHECWAELRRHAMRRRFQN